MSNLEKLKKRIGEQLHPEEAEIVFDFMKKLELTEEAAKGLLALDQRDFIETVETKSVRQFAGAQIVESEDFGNLEIKKNLPSIGNLLLIAASLSDRQAIEQSARSREERELYSLFGDLITPTARAKQPDKHTIVTTGVAREIKKNLGTIISESEKKPGHADLTSKIKYHNVLLSTKILAVYTAKGTAEFEPIDASISGGIVDLIEAGNLKFTPAMIWRATAQLKDGQKVSPQQEKLVTEVIERGMATLLFLDITEEVNEFGLQDRLIEYYNAETGRYEIKVNMLSLKPSPVNVNGRIKRGWKVLVDPETKQPEYPGLYQHAILTARKEDRAQIASYTSDQISMNGRIAMTETVVVIRDLILDNLHRIGQGKTSPTITFAQIFKAAKCDFPGEDAREKERLKKARSSAITTTGKILEQLKQNGTIKNFKTDKKGVEITLIEKGDLLIRVNIDSRKESRANNPKVAFSFSIKLKKSLHGTFGDVSFMKGEASVTIPNGTTKRIPGLPANTGYKITPTGSGDFRPIKVSHDEGAILADKTLTVNFTFSHKSEIREDYT